MAQNLTYYIGAGASFHSLPLQGDMYDRLKIYLNAFVDAAKEHTDRQEIENILNNFNGIVNEVRNSTSFDSYAKELSNNGSWDILKYAKVLLSSFLLFEQFNKEDSSLFKGNLSPIEQVMFERVRTIIDKRYRTFWGSIFQNGYRFLPEHIRIISWNYDLQFEMSHSKHTKMTLQESIDSLKIYPIHSSSARNGIIKLNGTSGYFYADKEPIHPIADFQNKNYNANINQLIGIVIAGCNKNYTQPFLNFAWEKNREQEEAIRRAKNVIQETRDLVVIGYSFPRFNWEIDRQILADTPKITGFYYQTLENDYEEQLDNLRAVNSGLASLSVLRKKVDTFFIPPDY